MRARPVLIVSMLLVVSVFLTASPVPETTSFGLNAHDLQMIWSWRFQDGDRQAWADPLFIDSDWPIVDPNRLSRLEAGVHWLRAPLDLAGEQYPDDVIILRFSQLPGAFEVYWDGSLVGENGRVGRGLDEEITGRVATMVKLPRSASGPGRHLLAIRFSNFHKPRQLLAFWAAISYHQDYVSISARSLNIGYFHVGIYLISTFVGLSLFLGGGRHRAFLLFAIYSLLATYNWAINPLNEAFNFDIRSFQLLTEFRLLAFLNSWVLLNIFFILHFEIPRKKIHFPLIVMIPLAIEAANIRFLLGFDLRNTILALYGIGLLVYALKRRRTGSLIALLGTLALSFPDLYGNLNMVFPSLPKPDDLIFLLVSLIFVPSIILSISRQIREQNRLLEAARSRSIRLETQLLKSQIQPHFISNTLHSIQSWFREDPQRAEKMIQALSDEFRIISVNSSKILIPLSEEIRLCRDHLEIMGSRRDVRLDLAADDVPEDATVPPLLIHTLIENGITHALGPRESGSFRLQYDDDGRETVYTLSNGGSRLSEWARKPPSDLEEGMGLAYVRARLEESSPGRWKIDYGLKGDVWAVTIRITK